MFMSRFDSEFGSPVTTCNEVLQEDTFCALLYKPMMGKLGLSISPLPPGLAADIPGLWVVDVPTGGAVDQYNRTANMNRKICPGDAVIGVDGALTVETMMATLEKKSMRVDAHSFEVIVMKKQVLNTIATASPRSLTASLASLDSYMPRSLHVPATKSWVELEHTHSASTATTTESSLGHFESSWFSSTVTSDSYESKDLCASAESSLTWADYRADSILQNMTEKSSTMGKSENYKQALDNIVAKKRRDDTAGKKKQNVAKGQPVEAAEFTTIMIRQLPSTFTRDELEKLLDSIGFAGRYDFAYVPMNLHTNRPFQYAFVNLMSSDDALACKAALDVVSIEDGQVLTTAWAESEQGVEANIRRYRNSPVMHKSVPQSYKPALYSGGLQIPFPAPTQVLKEPPRRRCHSDMPKKGPLCEDIPLPLF